MTATASLSRRSLLACASLLAGTRAMAATPALDAPNVVVISPLLVTSGQPTAASLGTLKAQGFEADIYLAPPTVPDAVRDEQAIVERQGLSYLNIPIPFGEPAESHYEAFAAAMAQLAGRKVLVHCQVNMRASSLVFLHRVIAGHEQPDKAYESVAKVWSPRGPWKALIQKLLRGHGIGFEPY
ncbi:MAG TPA: protein tyrosine phosphatase family protein [Ideonella sp.]|nr:protein tyrosine phosphatase family protein [Ideonella sp.]